MPLAGGILIGVSSLTMLALLGRITGISGIFAGAIQGETGMWRWAFLAGLIAAPLLYHGIGHQSAPLPSEAGWLLTMIAGLLVGFGTRHAGGCTSGHGVCGIGRLSPRSIAATMTFIASGMVTVFVTRHLL
jgi:hypothetical protein